MNNALGLIIHREYMSRVKTKAFVLTTILTPFIFLLISILPQYLKSINDTDIKTVFIIDETGKYASLFESSDTYTFVQIMKDESEDKMDALLQINKDLSEHPLAATFFSEQQQPPRDLIRYINDVLTDAVKADRINEFTTSSNLEPEIVVNLQSLLNSKEAIHINTLRWADDGMVKDTLGETASAIGILLTLMMMMFMTMYGSWVIQSVVEEKSNRIIEVIISSVKPFDLMMGKIIGIALVGLTQLFMWAIIGWVAILAIGLSMGNPAANMNVGDMQEMATMMGNNPDLAGSFAEIASINWLQIGICFILYFIGGYLLYASLFAMFGSAANDSQEAQQFTTPLMIVLFSAVYIGFAAGRNPEGGIAFWCSLIPFTSPVVMMVRTPFEIPIWELVVSLVILYATAIAFIVLAAKIYRIGILMHGKKVGFKELIKWFSYK